MKTKQLSLYNADCNTVLPSLKTASVAMVMTDPPYGINYKSNMQGWNNRGEKAVRTGRKEYHQKISGDSSLPTEWLDAAFNVLVDGGALYVFTHWLSWQTLVDAAKAAGFKVKNMIVVSKSNSGMGDLKGAYSPQHELILFATKGRHVFKTGKRPADVWQLPVFFSGRKRLHPNEKPCSWFTRAIEQSSNAGDTVLDPFMGCGPCGEEALALGRRYIGIEIDPEHFENAKARLSKVKA